MKSLKTILLAGGATVLLAAAAQAADLPTKKAPVTATTNCLADFYSWFNASAAECPLSYGGVTVYGQVDIGLSAQSNAAPFGDKYPASVNYVIGAQNHGSRLQWVDNALSPSNIGIKFTEKLGGDVSLIGDWRIAYNPLSFDLLNGPGSLIDNNSLPAQWRTASASSSLNGSAANNRAWIGLQSPTLGTLKVGRIYNFYNDLEPLYDAVAGAYGFGALGYSSTWSSGFGITETNRMNVGASYVYDYQKMFHVGGQTQLGDYSLGNAAKYQYSFDIGGGVQGFSADLIYQHATDAIHLSAYGTPTPPAGVDLTENLKATMANQDAWAFLAKYNYQAFTIYGTYSWSRLTNPTDKVYANGFQGVIGSDYTVLPGAISTSAYNIAQTLQATSVSGKYAVNPQIDLMATYAYIWQNNFDTAPAVNCVYFSTPQAAYNGAIPVGTKKSDCAGHTSATSFLIDWRPVKRVDVYGGVMFSQGAGGMVSGYWADTNTAVTGGVRLTF